MSERNLGVIDRDTGELVIPENGYSVELYELESGEFTAGLENLSQEELSDIIERRKETHRIEIFI